MSLGFMTMMQNSRDQELKHALEAELDWTPAVDATRIGVAVNDGAVSLFGDVSSYPQKDAAVQAALRIRGVLAVADEIVVHSQWGAGARDDIDIAREAAATLNRSVLIPKDAVHARVQDGIVTLTGQVAWQYERDEIHHAVSVLSGVVLVRNDITLAPVVTMMSPSDARTKITAALLRNARLDSERVEIDVVGTEVTLTGTVSSWHARREAGDAAWAAPGVTAVENLLRVNF
jgi:osmotically-inducible protein OsmY